MDICFDMDGTIADLYGVQDWLTHLENEDVYPYLAAKPLVRLSVLARYIHKLQQKGYRVIIISWLSKSGSAEYNEEVTAAKLEWLAKHLPSVTFDEIHIIPYGEPKINYGNGILFDDEEDNRDLWDSEDMNFSFDACDIFKAIKDILR
mgnify:FL=1